MARRQEHVTIYVCDACPAVFTQPEGDDLPPGFHGTVYEMTDSNGPTSDQDWFACRPAHIRQAVLNVIERWRNDPMS